MEMNMEVVTKTYNHVKNVAENLLLTEFKNIKMFVKEINLF